MEKKEYYCHFELTLDIVGGKWKPIILYYLGKYNNLRYAEIKRFIPAINERVLSRQLKELVDDKLVNRIDYREKPLRVEYTLTELGMEVIPLLNQLKEWGKGYNKRVEKASVVAPENREDFDFQR